VYDVTNFQSFINLKDWLQKIREFSDPHVVIVLVANKIDMVEEDDRTKGYGRFANQKQELPLRRVFSDPEIPS
jgi:GTPase SAR1 family protein